MKIIVFGSTGGIGAYTIMHLLGTKKYESSRRVKVEYSAKGKHMYPVKDW